MYLIIAMNLLAHLYLSGKDPQVILGNFIADAVKGRQKHQYAPKIQEGIHLHHTIDTFTDEHPKIRHSTQLLRSKYHMYAGVIVDLTFDHFLANNWDRYTEMNMDSFINRSYELLLKNYLILPKRTRKFLPFMIMQNWLKNYIKLEGLHQSLSGLSRRTTFDSGMEFAIEDIKHHYSEMQNDFLDFFPELIAFVRRNPAVLWYDQE
ncbi:MAG: ACP phosphodiesterase [Bacteroidales bacterium]|nr:ACP phosphodiesterase [Bacteroidales bacterium]